MQRKRVIKYVNERWVVEAQRREKQYSSRQMGKISSV